MLEWWSWQCEDIRMFQLMSRACLYLETCHFIIMCFIRENVVPKLWMFKCDVSVTFNKWFWYIISLYCHLHRSGVICSLYNTTCSTLNHVADASKPIYTGCPRRIGQNFGRVFVMSNYTDITQNTYIQSWTVKEILAIKKCGLLGCPRTVRRPWPHINPLRMPGNETPLTNSVMQWPWRDNGTAAACVNYLET